MIANMAVRANMACTLWSMSLLLADSIYVKYRIFMKQGGGVGIGAVGVVLSMDVSSNQDFPTKTRCQVFPTIN